LSQPVLQYASGAPRGGSDLARRTAHGFLWLMAQTIGSKAVGMTGQVVLAWLVMPQDLGLWGKATIVMGFSGLIQQAGLRETLINRQRAYHVWASAAFWMSVALGLLGAVITAAVAKPAAVFFNEPRLVGMLYILAFTAPFMSLDQIAEAKLQINMRFGLLAGVNWAVELLRLGLTVLFAVLIPEPYKAYAFVLPRPFVALARLSVLWVAARPPVRMHPQVRRWKYLTRDSLTLLTSNFFLMLQWQGDYIVIGRLFATAILGIYFQAYNLSIQTMQLFTGNLTGVLFPALSKLQTDPKRQLRAFLDATRLMALIAVPLCMLQMAGADPAVRLFFQDSKWQDAIPVLQALSIGMAFRVVASPGGSLIQAQGRFRVIMITNVINAVVFLSLVIAGAKLGRPDDPNVWLRPASTVGVAVAIYFAIIGPIFLYVAIRPSGGTWGDIVRVYAAPLAVSAVAAVVGMALGHFVPVERIRGHRWGQAVRLAVIVVWFLIAYVPLIRLIAPSSWQALVQRLSSLWRGKTAVIDGEGAAAAPVAV
jgi:O-antigen/teichoic acid export membrane protein